MRSVRTRVLVVTSDEALRRKLEGSLADLEVVAAPTPASAKASLAADEPAAIVCDVRLDGGSGIDLLAWAARERPDTVRLLVSSREDLPEIIRATARGTVARVLARSARDDAVRRVVRDALGLETDARRDTGPTQDDIRELLRWTAGRATQVDGVFVRELVPTIEDLQIQFVFPTGSGFEAFRGAVGKHWPVPIKDRGGELVDALDQGQATAKVPDETSRPDLFSFSTCHGHYHFNGFASYELLDMTGKVVLTGAKQAYCMEDTIRVFSGPTVGCDKKYDCASQGIQNGWSDLYGNALDCQWLDVTGIAPGNYQLRVTVNPNRAFEESSFDNNSTTVPVTIQ